MREIEELSDDGADTTEVPWPTSATEPLGKLLLINVHRMVFEIHVRWSREEDRCRTCSLALCEIRLLVTWILLVIFARTELNGIDENRHDDLVRLFRLSLLD